MLELELNRRSGLVCSSITRTTRNLSIAMPQKPEPRESNKLLWPGTTWKPLGRAPLNHKMCAQAGDQWPKNRRRNPTCRGRRSSCLTAVLHQWSCECNCSNCNSERFSSCQLTHVSLDSPHRGQRECRLTATGLRRLHTATSWPSQATTNRRQLAGNWPNRPIEC